MITAIVILSIVCVLLVGFLVAAIAYNYDCEEEAKETISLAKTVAKQNETLFEEVSKICDISFNYARAAALENDEETRQRICTDMLSDINTVLEETTYKLKELNEGKNECESMMN